MSAPPIDLMAARKALYGAPWSERVAVLRDATARACDLARRIDPERPDAALLDELARQLDGARTAALRAAQAARGDNPKGAA